MKLVISIMLMFAIFPIINILCRAFNISNISNGIIFTCYTIESVLITIITFFSGAFIKSKHKKNIQNIIIVGTSALLGFIYSLIVKDISLTFWIISSIIFALILKKIYNIDNEKFSNIYIFIIVSAIYLICIFLGWQSELGYSKVFNTISYLIFCIGFALSINRNNLEKVIYRRTQNLDSVPKDIFKYNSKLTILLCLIPIPILIFSNRIGNAIYGLTISLFRGIIYIGKLISSLFAKDNIPIETIENESLTYNTYYENGSGMFWDIFTIIFLVFISYLVYRYHEDFLKKIKEIISNIKLRFKKSNEISDIKRVPSNDGYTDYIKDISNLYDKKSFKNDYKSYLKMSTSTDTLKFGYSTLIHGLNLLNYNISQHDTITDISKKFDCEQFSNIYLSIRYNDIPPTNENRQLLDNLLKKVSKKI